ncbi:MAG: UbiD family decarboxylase, partial [Thermoprotei archaeon]
MYEDLRSFTKYYDERGEVKYYETQLSTNLEIAREIFYNDEGDILFFKRVKNYKLPVVANVLARRSRLLFALKSKSNAEAYTRLLEASRNPLTLREKDDAPFLECSAKDLRALPILKHFSADGGPYITSGIVVAKDVDEDIYNASFHRLQVIDPQHLVIRVVPRHLYTMMRKAWDKGKDLEIAIVLGVSPTVMIAAAASPPYGIFELEVANRILEGSLEGFRSPNGIIVPRMTEIVIQGRILRETFHNEGPFVDITGTYDIVRKQPVVEVEKVYLRENAWYEALLPSGSEHRLLMGFEREARIWDTVRRVVPRVKAVRLTKGGCGWLHCVISLKKQSEGDAKNAILAA